MLEALHNVFLRLSFRGRARGRGICRLRVHHQRHFHLKRHYPGACSRALALAILAALSFTTCARRPEPNTLVMIIESSPVNLDPRVGTDAQSERSPVVTEDLPPESVGRRASMLEVGGGGSSRPIAGTTPRIRRKFSLTYAPVYRWACPFTVTLTVDPLR